MAIVRETYNRMHWQKSAFRQSVVSRSRIQYQSRPVVQLPVKVVALLILVGILQLLLQNQAKMVKSKAATANVVSVSSKYLSQESSV